MSPPLPVSPVPTASSMSPPEPWLATPLEISTLPESPAVAVPVESIMLPLTPAVPASAVAMVTAPLLVALPFPLIMSKLPPVE